MSLTPWRRIALLASLMPWLPAAGQQPTSLADAMRRALEGGAATTLARTDTMAAAAQLGLARAWENPALSLSYTKDTPRYHAALDLPLDLPARRRLRIRVAGAEQSASRTQLSLAEATARFEVEAAYAEAAAASQRAILTRRSRDGADSLLQIAKLRRDAGDAADLDVDVAEIDLRQVSAAASGDSLRAVTALLEVQRLMGIPSDNIAIALTDSLGAMLITTEPASAATKESLRVRAASQLLAARELEVTLARRKRWMVPAVSLGVDTYDPGNTGNRLLPAVGLSIPVPLFHRYRADIALAEAGAERARVELAVAERESAGAVAQARSAWREAQSRLTITQGSLEAARRISERTLLAYREGAVALPYVLQAQRAARDAAAEHIDAQLSAIVAAAAIRLLTAGSQP